MAVTVAANPIALTVFNHKTDEMMAGCDLSPKDWKRLCETAKARGVSVGKLLADTVQKIEPDDKTSRKSQVKNSALHREQLEMNQELAMPEGDVHNSCLTLFDREMQVSFAKVPLSEEEFSDMIDRSIKISCSPGKFIAQAVREKVAKGKIKGIGIESAMWQANSFIRMLVEKLEEVATGPNEFRGQYVDRYLGGVSMLMINVTSQLEEAVYSEIHAAGNSGSQAA